MTLAAILSAHFPGAQYVLDGDSYEGLRWDDPTAKPTKAQLDALASQPVLPPMADITDRQFGEGLWRDALISYQAYIAFVGPGVIPPPLDALLGQLPDDDTGRPTPQKVARGLVTGAQLYRFDNPLVDLIRQAQGWTVEHLRERWSAWANL